jgi:PPOX class probable F420-dependent enzyme
MDSTALATEPFVSITTFKRDGTPVSVPVWCAADNGSLLVFSEADSWKAKRIRRDAHVRLAPCSARGTPRGPAVDADASLVEETTTGPSAAGAKVRLGVARIPHAHVVDGGGSAPPPTGAAAVADDQDQASLRRGRLVAP